MIFLKLCGILAGLCTTGSLVPQVYRLATLRSATEIALGFLTAYGLGVGLFWTYGLRRADLIFQIVQLATALLIMTMVLLTVAYGDPSPRTGTAVIASMLVIPAAAYLLPLPTDLIGTAAAILASTSLLPQILRTARLRSAHELSWMYLGTFGLGVSLWFCYGLAFHAPPIYIPQIITGILIATTAILKATQLHPAQPHPTPTRPQTQPQIPQQRAWTPLTTLLRHTPSRHTPASPSHLPHL